MRMSGELLEQLVLARKPWNVQKIDLKETSNEVDFYLGLDHDSNMFRCNKCNKPSAIVDSNFFMWRSFTHEAFHCRVYVKIPIVKCEKHGIHSVDKNKFRRLGNFIQLNYSERLLKRVTQNTSKDFKD